METESGSGGGRASGGSRVGGSGEAGRSSARVEKSDAEWREELTEEEYRIAREGGTERAFTGRYWDTKTEGVYRCTCCGTPLFTSKEKYDSGSGWPSFWAPAEEGRVRAREDRSLGMRRTEALCSVCDAHLGHVFPDGPRPTGLRYCINSASLELDEGREKAEPEESEDGSEESP